MNVNSSQPTISLGFYFKGKTIEWNRKPKKCIQNIAKVSKLEIIPLHNVFRFMFEKKTSQFMNTSDHIMRICLFTFCHQKFSQEILEL